MGIQLFFSFWTSHSNASIRCFGFEIQMQNKCAFVIPMKQKYNFCKLKIKCISNANKFAFGTYPGSVCVEVCDVLFHVPDLQKKKEEKAWQLHWRVVWGEHLYLVHVCDLLRNKKRNQ